MGPVNRRAIFAAGGGAFVLRPGVGAAYDDNQPITHRTPDAHISLWDFVDREDRVALEVGSRTPDLTRPFQRAVNAAIRSRRTLYVPGTHPGTDVMISSPISVSGPLSVVGDGEGLSRILCFGCDGFVVVEGVVSFSLSNLNISLNERFVNSSGEVVNNNKSAIRVLGTRIKPCYRFHFRRVFFDGFWCGVEADFLCQSSFDISSVYVGIGIWLRGQSVNNVVLGSSQIVGVDSINTAHAPGTSGIRIGSLSGPQPEGFTIQPGVLVFGFAIGLWVQGAINVNMTGAICDGMSECGVLEEGSDQAPSFGNNYNDNYLGMTGRCGAALLIRSTASHYRNDSRGTTLRNNEICLYAGALLDYGFLVEGDRVENVSIIDNKLVRGMQSDGSLIETLSRDCKVAGGRGHRIVGNAWSSSTGFETSVPVQYEGNSGRVAGGLHRVFHYEAGQRITYGEQSPVSGDAAVGDRHMNLRPSFGQPFGWVCVEAGTPGAWMVMGIISVN